MLFLEGEKNIENVETISDVNKSRIKKLFKRLWGFWVLENDFGVYRKVINDVVPLGIGLTKPSRCCWGYSKSENKNR